MAKTKIVLLASGAFFASHVAMAAIVIDSAHETRRMERLTYIGDKKKNNSGTQANPVKPADKKATIVPVTPRK